MLSHAEITARLRSAGCVFAEDEATLLCAIDGPEARLAESVARRVAGHVLGWARFCGQQGHRIVEVNRPDRSARRRQGKSDPIDAEAAARSVLAGTAQAIPKAGDGQVEMIRSLQLARRHQQLTEEIGDLDAHLTRLVTVVAPKLIAIKGLGPLTSAALLVAAGDNPDRMRSESAFAHLYGAAPVPARSSAERACSFCQGQRGSRRRKAPTTPKHARSSEQSGRRSDDG